MRSHDLLIVGNGVAGFACATAAVDRGLRPLLVGPGLPYDRPPLTKAALASGDVRPYADRASLAERGVDLLDGVVVDADLATRTVRVRTQGKDVHLRATVIVLAIGLQYRPPPVPGLEAAHTTSTPDGLVRIAPSLCGGPKRVAVVGGGLIGCETAATLARGGHHVTVLDLEPRPLNRLHDPIPDVAATALAGAGVTFTGSVRVVGVEPPTERAPWRVHAAEGTTWGADIVIAATGGRPMTLPGLEAADGRCDVDGSMRVAGYDGVYAIGDCAAPLHARFGRLRMPHWDVALGTARRAAEAISGEAGEYDRLPYWWTDIGAVRIAEVGVADAATDWEEDGTLHIGRDATGSVVCAIAAADPRRLREARDRVLAG